MKRTKLARTLLAGLLSVQCGFSYAQGSRIEGIGEVQAMAAQQQLVAIQQQLALLDNSLAQTAQAIQNREKGRFTNGAAVTAAGVGAGVSVLSLAGSEPVVLLGVVVSLMATGISVLCGTGSEIFKSGANTEKIELQTAEAKKAVAAAAAKTSDKKDLAILYKISSSLTDVEAALQVYRVQDDANTRNRVVSTILQTAGFFTLGYSMSPKGVDVKHVFTAGLGLLTVGNISRFVSGLSDSQAEATLAEILKTRQFIANASAALAN